MICEIALRIAALSDGFFTSFSRKTVGSGLHATILLFIDDVMFAGIGRDCVKKYRNQNMNVKRIYSFKLVIVKVVLQRFASKLNKNNNTKFKN